MWCKRITKTKINPSDWLQTLTTSRSPANRKHMAPGWLLFGWSESLIFKSVPLIKSQPVCFFFKALTLPLSFQQPTCECLFPSLLTSLAFWSSLTFGKKLSRQRQHLLCPYPLLRLYLLFLKRTNPVSKILSLHFSPLTIIHLLWSPFSFPLHHLFTSSSSSSLSVPQMQAYFCKHKQLVPNLLSHLLLCQKHAMRTWLCTNKTKCSRFVEFSKS